MGLAYVCTGLEANRKSRCSPSPPMRMRD